MSPRHDRVTLFNGTTHSTDVSRDSPIVDTEGYPAGWVELLVPNAGGTNNLACTIDFLGGAYPDAAKLKQLYLDTAHIYFDNDTTRGKLSETSLTGFTHGGATNPGRISIAADLAASTRIFVPMINWRRFFMLRITRSGGGSAAEFYEGAWDGRSSS
jgi:hypothetical protein